MPDVIAPPAPAAAPVAAPAAAPVPAAVAAAPSFGSLIQKAADAEKAKTAPAPAKSPVKMADPSKPDPMIKTAGPKLEPPKAPETKAEPPKPEPAPAKADGEIKPKMSDLLHKAEKERDHWKSEAEKAKTGKPAEDPEKKVLSERLTKAETRAKELESEMQYVDYQKSAEFKEKFFQPYVELYQQHAADALELVVTQEDGTRRTLTQEEYGKVISAPTVEEADQIANELFPNHPTKATLLMDMRKEVKRAYLKMNGALQEFRAKGAERAAQKAAEMAEMSKTEKAQYAAEVEAVAAELPQYFKPGEDAAENATREKYAKIVDATLDSDKPNVKNVARLRHAGVAFPIVMARLEKAVARITELEAQVAAFDASTPGAGSPTAEKVGASAPAEDSFAARLQRKADGR